MRPFALRSQDQKYADRLEEILVTDLYRRALLPLVLFIPILYVLYRVIASAIPARPVLNWIFAGMIVVLIPRIAAVIFVDRIKARYPAPRVRVAIFAIAAALLGSGMAAINIIAAPVVAPEQLALMAIVAAGINSIAIISMSPSLLSYLLYMVPNIASMALAVLIGPKLLYGNILLFLIGLNLLSLIVMATYVHLAMRESILLLLRVDDANGALQEANERLETEARERLAAEAAVNQRNIELEILNKQLATAHSQLLQSEKLASVGQLAAGIAHEINNPIAFVHSNLNSLEHYAKDIFSVLDAYEEAENSRTETREVQQLKNAINIQFLRGDIPALISESSNGLTRVKKIVEDLKEFTHLDQGEWQCVDIHEGMERTLNIAMHQIRPKADIVREYGDVPPIECMAAQINQLFLNLLLNAAQAIQTRGTITIRTGRDEKFVSIAISDTGKGIEPAQLSRIFDPFFTTQPVGSGIGLGLTVCYNIVQQHGGSIEAASEVGKGSTFTLRLPIHPKRTPSTA